MTKRYKIEVEYDARKPEAKRYTVHKKYGWFGDWSACMHHKYGGYTTAMFDDEQSAIEFVEKQKAWDKEFAETRKNKVKKVVKIF